MFKRGLPFFLCLIIFLESNGQILPLPGAKITYNQVMFEYGKVTGSGYYLLQLIEDTSGASFIHPLVQQKDSSTATLISNLQFGKKYQWRYAAIREGETPVWKGPYRFEIVANPLLDNNFVRFTVTKNDTTANAGGLIVNDCMHTICDRSGKLVWYLDKVDWHVVLKKKNLELKPQILDLRLTPYGTVTFLADSLALECDLNGNALWIAPNDGKVSGGATEWYNHDFKRLPNGHYMVLSNELWRKLPPYLDTLTVKKKYPIAKVVDGKEFAKADLATVIEYDKKGKVVWSWSSKNYLDSNAIAPKKTSDSVDYELDAHVNAFSVDAKNQYVYVGFRNISRVVKVEKKTGRVADSWGLKLPSGEARNSVLIHQQHDANVIDDSSVAVFNSNDYPGRDSFSRAVIFSTLPGSDGKITWSFDCDFDSLDRHAYRSGGNVDKLKNGNLLVCMGNMNYIFEVTPDKKIVWQSIIKAGGKTGEIYFHRLYRAHYVSSLYPCYFTFQANRDTVSQKAPNFKVRIFNKGSESDSYQVKIRSSSGTFLKQFKTATLGAGQSDLFEIKPGKVITTNDKIEIVINSITNPDFERKDEISVVK